MAKRPFSTLLALATTAELIDFTTSTCSQDAFQELHEPEYAVYQPEFAQLLGHPSEQMRDYGVHFLCIHAQDRNTLEIVLGAAATESDPKIKLSMAQSIAELIVSPRFPGVLSSNNSL